MNTYNFYIKGPDDAQYERIGVGTVCDFEDMLDRHTQDEICRMTTPLSNNVLRQERGRSDS